MTVTIQPATGVVLWEGITIRPGMSFADLRQTSIVTAAKTMANRANPSGATETLRCTLSPATVDQQQVNGYLSFADDKARALHFWFSVPGDEGGWDSNSGQADFTRHSLGLALLEASLGQPHNVQVYEHEGFQFRQCRYKFSWGEVVSYFDGRGGGTEVVISYTLD